MTYFWNI